MVLLGLGAPVQGWTTRAAMAANFTGTCFVWTPACAADNAAKYPHAVHLVRLDTPILSEDPRAYAERQAERVRAWLQHPCWRDTEHPMDPAYPVFIVGNEPEIAGVDVEAGHEWSIATWLTAAPRYALSLRNRWPGIVLASAALKTEDTHFVTADYLAAFDVHTAHCYWQVEADITNPNLGGAWRYVADAGKGQPLFVTEVNSVAPDGSTEVGTRPHEILGWLNTLDGRVEGICLFIADGAGDPQNATDDPRTGWWQFDVSPDVARLISTATIPPQPPNNPAPAPIPPAPAPVDDGNYQICYPLDQGQFEAILDEPDATIAGAVSPLRSAATYQDLLSACQGESVDPRLPLAFMWAEGHFGTDPGLAAAVVNNWSGIKWVGQAWATDSGIAADTGGTYAAYANFGAYIRDWLRIMRNDIIGPDFTSGNLIGACEHYTNGPGTGHDKAARYYQYVAAYPSSNGPGRVVVTRERIAAEAESQLGSNWSVPYDAHNPPHYWCNPATNDYWCESFRERVGEHCGLSVVPSDTAADAGRALIAARKMNTTDPPPRGACIFLDERFWPAGGHTGICDDASGMRMVCTATPEGIARRPWGMQTIGYMGWADFDGVGEQPPEVDMRVDGERNDPGTFARQWYGPSFANGAPTADAPAPYNPDWGIPALWRGEFMAGRPLGYAVSGEESDPATPHIVVQYFSNGHITYDTNLNRGWVN